MKNYEIAAMDKKELLSKIKELENRLADLNFYQAIEPAQNPMVFRNLKRDIARMKTRLTQIDRQEKSNA
ncbi:MAG TPA: 50S ribosomal protein L29 [Chlorobaculum sp.]|jgi:large subunit ribosomal protein L29|uniref:Large ribosomal subunit protein uL29 n=1 Tax=Chlorobaculum tepidum (strain ATCC 49652 / DSM 12025 / NBRC 103806 / TLS) TaxID=194439 RepID=RL29_CHLTE|nr:50S ribosomal protein L29 [Chlorobaculum tepidum]Q8KAI0.1 RecName: Full=Large ribosomal subunit protein uL29; AltName: Full=50S ribosomal protein L29 [Chlorobaculum tepidum TLS]AAM73397.1 ribosomal protein L29 [Chlorobaculum tepidum TLS]HBU23223.1 50S ribosomal protein L29 [Chlorobaculum sp.]